MKLKYNANIFNNQYLSNIELTSYSSDSGV